MSAGSKPELVIRLQGKEKPLWTGSEYIPNHPRKIYDQLGKLCAKPWVTKAATFKWARGPQALTVFLIKSVLWGLETNRNGDTCKFWDRPEQTLFEALKRPGEIEERNPWTSDIFGYDDQCQPFILKLLRPAKTGDKGTVELMTHILSSKEIQIWWDNEDISTDKDMLELLIKTMASEYFGEKIPPRVTDGQLLTEETSVAIDQEDKEDFSLYSPEGQVDTRLAAAAIKKFESYALVSIDGERASFGCMPKKVPQPVYTLIDGICLGLAVRFAVTTGLSEKAVCEGKVVPLKQVRSKDHVKFHHTIAYFLKLAWIRSYQLYKIFKYDSMAPRTPKFDLPKIRAIVEDVCDCNGNQLEVTFQQVIALHLKQEPFMGYCAGLGDEIQSAIMPHLDDLRVLVGFCFVYGALAARAEGEKDMSFDRLELRHYDSPTVDKLSKEFLNFDIDAEKLGDVVLLAKYGVAK